MICGKYNTATGQWTWSAAPRLWPVWYLRNKNGALGTNVPGARETAMCWLDPSEFSALWDSQLIPWVIQRLERYVGIHGRPMDLAEWRQRCSIKQALTAHRAWQQLRMFRRKVECRRPGRTPSKPLAFRWTRYDSSGNGSLADLWTYTGGQWVWVKGPGPSPSR